MVTISKTKNLPKKVEMMSGFLGGLNVFQDETLIKDSELTKAKNIILNVDGISPRPGTTDYGSESGDRVTGSFAYYQANGTRELLRFSKGINSKLQKMVGDTPTDIGSTTYDEDYPMNFVQANNLVWLFNGEDPLTYYDGSTITTYTPITTPTNFVVVATGITGSTSYSYRVSAFNDVGETLACTSVSIANGNETLNASNYNDLSWTAVSGAKGYNIYGRTATGLGETFMETIYTNAYKDSGQVEYPSTSILPPEANSTEGIVGKYAVFALSRIFVAGVKDNPSRLSFSGLGAKVGNFADPTYGAGGVDVYKNDGASITGIIPFQGGVIVFKENAIYKFSFTTDGFQQLEEIVKGFGACSFRSIRHVENDIIFAAKKDGRIAFYSLGNQAEYVSTVLRTNELSIKVAPLLEQINLDGLENISAFYFNNLYMCSVPTENSNVNDRTWILDTRFGAWVYWDGFSVNNFVKFFDSNGNEKMLFGDDESGYFVEMFQEDTNDNGLAIDVEFATKAFNQGQFAKTKRYFRPTFQVKDVENVSTLDCYIYADGRKTYAPLLLSTLTLGGGGVGAYLPGFNLPGSTPMVSAGDTGTPNDTPIEIYNQWRARSIKYSLESDIVDATYKLLSITHIYSILNRRLSNNYRTYIQ